MKKGIVCLVLLFGILLSSCSTDLDVTGEWKETMVVYGLIDQSQDTQFVKINKSFLGQGDATLFAQIKDSVQYPNVLTVELLRIKPGSSFSPVYGMQYDSITKDIGVFYSGNQKNAIYAIPTPIGSLLEDSQYKIKITNSETGKVVTSQTPLVADFSFSIPHPLSVNFYVIKPLTPTWPFVVEWTSSKNGRLYQLVMRMHYTDSLATGGNKEQIVDFIRPSMKTERLNGGETMTVSFQAQDFLKNIGNQVSIDGSVIKRTAGLVELMVTGGADDLSTFIDVNEPSTGIIQERPEFTNINGGIGVFSARYTKAFIRPLHPVTLDSLACGQYTKQLKFVNSLGQVIVCP